ncbi:hypothetical protein EJB05_28363, partial [Eragrostis curvula]
MILHGLSLIIGVLLNVQACIQYFVWIEYSLLDGITYTVSSWFLKWRTWPNESSDKALDVYRLTLLKFVDQSIKQLDCLLYVSTSWAMGLVIGPAIGGYLAQPAEKYPFLFPVNSFLGRYIYYIHYAYYETLHTHESGKQRDQENESLTEHLATDSVEFDEQQISLTTKRNLFTNWPLMSSITLYCIACFDDMAYSEIFPIWAESDRSYGGLSMSSEDVGQVLAITGASILLYQTFLYPHKVKALGPINASRVTAILSMILLFTFPPMAHLSKSSLSIVLTIVSVLKANFTVTIVTSSVILQNNSVTQYQRGAANGLANTLMSFSKALAPAGAGIITMLLVHHKDLLDLILICQCRFSWAQKRQHSFFFPGKCAD